MLHGETNTILITSDRNFEREVCYLIGSFTVLESVEIFLNKATQFKNYPSCF